MLKVNLIKQSELSHTEILLLKWSKGVYEEKLSVAPSTYYVLARMHEKGIGIHTNGFAAYAYYKKSIALEGKLNFFSPTWLAYRKYKARKKMKSEYFLKIVNELNSMTCDTMTEDESMEKFEVVPREYIIKRIDFNKTIDGAPGNYVKFTMKKL